MAHYTQQRRYGPDELKADAFVHGAGFAAALGSGVFLLPQVWAKGGSHLAAFCVYLAALLSMLAFSFAYNMAPHSPLKWVLRRFDHSAIYLLIAGTYTPLLLQLDDHWLALVLGAIVWSGATIGVIIKVFLPGRYDGLAVVTYLALGWVGVLAASAFWAVLPVTTMALIAAGGLLYTAGVPFYLWEQLKFQNAIWHAFVVSAAACHFVAIALIYL